MYNLFFWCVSVCVHVSAETCPPACDDGDDVFVCTSVRVAHIVCKKKRKRSPIVTRVFCVHFVLRADPVPDRK